MQSPPSARLTLSKHGATDSTERRGPDGWVYVIGFRELTYTKTGKVPY